VLITIAATSILSLGPTLYAILAYVSLGIGFTYRPCIRRKQSHPLSMAQSHVPFSGRHVVCCRGMPCQRVPCLVWGSARRSTLYQSLERLWPSTKPMYREICASRCAFPSIQFLSDPHWGVLGISSSGKTNIAIGCGMIGLHSLPLSAAHLGTSLSAQLPHSASPVTTCVSVTNLGSPQ
jgi:hypothetical protein